MTGATSSPVLAAVEHEQSFVDTMLEIYRSVRQVTLDGHPDVRLSLSCGISFRVADGHVHRYQDLKRAAEAALMREEGGSRTKQRGTMSIASAPELPAGDEDRTLLWIRCSLAVPRVFGNAWLNLISNEVETALAEADDPSAAVDRLAHEMQLKQASAPKKRFSSNPRVSGTKELTQLDVALAVLHGIAAHRLQLQDRGSAVGVELFVKEGAATVRCDALEVALPGEFNDESRGSRLLATIPSAPAGLQQPELGSAMKTALLVHVGEAPQSLLDLPFCASIFVDDRPTKGGQLPDFWEHILSELFATLKGNPNIRGVYCWGNETFAGRTLALLRSIGAGSVDQLKVAKAVGRPESEVSELCERLRGAVFVIDEIQAIVKHYLTESERIKELWEPVPAPAGPAPTLIRTLATDQYSLEINEGFRAHSIGEAVPLALEILRQPSQVNLVNDRYGRVFHELTDFKIVIEPPEFGGVEDMEHVDPNQLRDYYSRAFGTETGSLFAPEIGPQIPRFLDELQAGIVGPSPFSSRRAIIVIPNKLDDDGLHPLGLIAIRASVASNERLSALRFTYYWRTVEALVGLPHSLCASSQHASSLAQLLAERTNVTLPVARLTYIASSLHVSSEPSVLEIAKRIVDGASR